MTCVYRDSGWAREGGGGRRDNGDFSTGVSFSQIAIAGCSRRRRAVVVLALAIVLHLVGSFANRRR